MPVHASVTPPYSVQVIYCPDPSTAQKRVASRPAGSAPPADWIAHGMLTCQVVGQKSLAFHHSDQCRLSRWTHRPRRLRSSGPGPGEAPWRLTGSRAPSGYLATGSSLPALRRLLAYFPVLPGSRHDDRTGLQRPQVADEGPDLGV